MCIINKFERIWIYTYKFHMNCHKSFFVVEIEIFLMKSVISQMETYLITGKYNS